MTSFTLHGIPVSRGIAIGRAHILAPAALDVQHYLIAGDQVEAEVARLQSAIASVHTELQTIWRTKARRDQKFTHKQMASLTFLSLAPEPEAPLVALPWLSNHYCQR